MWKKLNSDCIDAVIKSGAPGIPPEKIEKSGIIALMPIPSSIELKKPSTTSAITWKRYFPNTSITDS